MTNLVSPFSRRVRMRALLCITVSLLMNFATPGVSGQVAAPSAQFSDDAEQGIMEFYVNMGWSLNDGVTNHTPVPTYATAPVHSGKYSYAIQANSWAYRPFGASPDPVYLKVWFFVPSTLTLGSGSSTRFAGLRTSGLTTYAVSLINNSGTLFLRAGNVTGTHPVTTNAWHSMEMKYSVAGSSETVLLDGTQDITATGLSLAATTYVYLGVDSSASGTIYFDDITVSSTQSGNPTSGMVVRHAYPGNRLAMKIKSYLWGASSTDQLVSSVDGNVFSTISNPGTYQEPVLTLTSLAAGSHTLQVQLLSSSGATRSTWTERFTASGLTPLVGIDENNNLVKGGHKVFPITPWQIGSANIVNWFSNGFINASGWNSAWASPYSTSQWQNFMQNSDPNQGVNCLSNGMPIMGPMYSHMGGTSTDAGNYALYASTFTNDPCMLVWTGYDEASVNGNTISTMQGSMNAVHANDNNHPFAYDDATFPLLHLEWYYPTFVADIYSSDNYPLCYAVQFHSQGKQMSDWVDEMDRETRANYGLVPDLQVVELYKQLNASFDCTTSNAITHTAISAPTMYNEAWMAVIHGRKGVSWYDNGVGTYTQCSSDAAGNCFPANPQNHIGKFTHDIATITPDVVLAAPTGRTVISNQTTKCNPSGPILGTRVDATVREDSNNVWVFAARLTDPLCTPTENSAAALNTQLTVSGLGSMTATVMNENRQVAVNNGVITDSFAPWAVHIYQIPKGTAGTPPPQPPPPQPQPTPPTMNPPVVN